MTNQEIASRIEEWVQEVATSKGLAAPKVTQNTALLGGGLPIDSLDLASLVVELEQLTGNDPFKKGFINFRTVHELAKLYEA